MRRIVLDISLEDYNRVKRLLALSGVVAERQVEMDGVKPFVTCLDLCFAELCKTAASILTLSDQEWYDADCSSPYIKDDFIVVDRYVSTPIGHLVENYTLMPR